VEEILVGRQMAYLKGCVVLVKLGTDELKTKVASQLKSVKDTHAAPTVIEGFPSDEQLAQYRTLAQEMVPEEDRETAMKTIAVWTSVTLLHRDVRARKEVADRSVAVLLTTLSTGGTEEQKTKLRALAVDDSSQLLDERVANRIEDAKRQLSECAAYCGKQRGATMRGVREQLF
jgi:phage terminase large subunit GpA-like protein